MKRNGLLIAAAVLSGILYGLPGVSVVWKLIVPGITAGMIAVLFAKSRGKGKTPLLFLLFLVLAAFCIALLRTQGFNKVYASEECRSFYEKYEATNPGEFDYAKYLKSLGITTEEKRKQLKERNEELESPLENRINDLSDHGAHLFELTLQEEDAGIMKAMILGDKSTMDEGTKQLYQSAGISHLLAVSGLHVGMIGIGCNKLLCILKITGKRTNLLISAFAVCFYCILTGSAASSVRAALMLCTGFAALMSGRKNDPVSTLCSALVCLLIYQPYLLLQSGFLLSFSAIAGVYAGSRLNNCYEVNNKLIGAYISCVAISLATLPVIASSYYKAPLFSVLLNILVIPLMSVLFLCGFTLLMLTGIFVKVMSVPVIKNLILFGINIFSLICTGLLKFYEMLCRNTLDLPCSQIILGKPSQGKTAAYYFLLLSVFYLLLRTRKRNKKVLMLLISGIYLAAFPFLKTAETEKSYVEVLDVGQGDCFHIHDGNRNIVIDCGSSGTERAGSRILEPYLLSKGIDRLDLIIVSHADADHINGILYLAGEESPVKTDAILLPALASKDEKYSVFEDCGSKLGNYQTGDTVPIGSGILSCIYSEEESFIKDDTNRESGVWLYQAGNFRMLFTGDITSAEEEKILRSDRRDKIQNLTVLKAAHHGSKTASSEAFLNTVKPEYTILSYGKNNRYGHPSAEVLDRLKSINTRALSTEKYGSIKIVPEGKSCRIDAWKQTGSE